MQHGNIVKPQDGQQSKEICIQCLIPRCVGLSNIKGDAQLAAQATAAPPSTGAWCKQEQLHLHKISCVAG